jgi:hypothetical protein
MRKNEVKVESPTKEQKIRDGEKSRKRSSPRFKGGLPFLAVVPPLVRFRTQLGFKQSASKLAAYVQTKRKTMAVSASFSENC